MPDKESLIRAVCEQPGEDTVRLAFADWLDENNDSERAEFIRVQIEFARPEPELPTRPSTLGIVARIAFPFGGAVAAMGRIDRYKRELNEFTAALERRIYLRSRERDLFEKDSNVVRWR